MVASMVVKNEDTGLKLRMRLQSVQRNAVPRLSTGHDVEAGGAGAMQDNRHWSTKRPANKIHVCHTVEVPAILEDNAALRVRDQRREKGQSVTVGIKYSTEFLCTRLWWSRLTWVQDSCIQSRRLTAGLHTCHHQPGPGLLSCNR